MSITVVTANTNAAPASTAQLIRSSGRSDVRETGRVMRGNRRRGAGSACCTEGDQECRPATASPTFVALQEPPFTVIVGIETPVDSLHFMPLSVSVAYLAESEKYDSSAVTRLRRSDFIAAMYAFDFVLANFGIAIAAKMPMMTTTIRSSMRVKPLRMFFILRLSPDGRG